MEIIEEEAFISWKEDVNQEYPGKGKALFQVILWKLLIFFVSTVSRLLFTMMGSFTYLHVGRYPGYDQVLFVIVTRQRLIYRLADQIYVNQYIGMCYQYHLIGKKWF